MVPKGTKERTMAVSGASQQPGQVGKPHVEPPKEVNPEIQKVAEGTARAASVGPLRLQSPTPSTPRAIRRNLLPAQNPEEGLNPSQVVKEVKEEGKPHPAAEEPTKEEVRIFLSKVKDWLQDPTLREEGEILFCTLALTCTDAEASQDLKEMAQTLVLDGLLPPTALNIGGSKDAGEGYFRNMIEKFKGGYAHGVNAQLLKQMEHFENDPSGKALIRRHPRLATEFKALVQETRKQELERLKRVGEELILGKKAQTSELIRLGFTPGERSEKTLKAFAADITSFAQYCQDPVQLEELSQTISSIQANRWAKKGTALGKIFDDPQNAIHERRKAIEAKAKPQHPTGLVVEIRDLITLSYIKPNEKISLDDSGRPIVLKKEALSRAFGIRPSLKSIAAAKIVLGAFKEAARSCSPEDLPKLIEAFKRFSNSSWLDSVCTHEPSVLEQYNQLAPLMNPSNLPMLRNQVQKPLPGVMKLSMPPLEDFEAVGVLTVPANPENRKKINLCAFVPFNTALESFTDKLTASQDDIPFHASCRGQPKKERRTLDDKSRMYDQKNPQPPTATNSDPVAGVVVSTADSYPLVRGRGIRHNDPVADDAQYVSIATDKPGTSVVVYSGADGSGPGLAARNAAKAANAGFVEHCQDALLRADSISLNEITRIAIEGVAKAQETVVVDHGSEDREKMTGLTTHCGIVYVQNTEGPSYAVAALTGDMKVFIRDKNGHIRDVTEGNRGGADPTDPGGQLGGVLGNDVNLPDIRNLTAYVITLQPGDELLPMSDGVHDNLDPSELGRTPEEAYDEIMEKGSEEQKAALQTIDREEIHAATQEWLKQRAGLKDGDLAKDQAGQPLPVARQSPWSDTPSFERLKNIYIPFKAEQIGKENPGIALSEALASYSMETTRGLREYAERQVPSNPWLYVDERTRKQLSGKLDHISCGQLGTPRSP